MKFLYLSALLFLFSAKSFAQLTDDFSDGDFTASPTWQGDTKDFIVNTSKQLQLNASASGISSLYIKSNISKSAEWTFSTQNRMPYSVADNQKIFLFADTNNFNLASFNGYFIQLSGGGGKYAIELRKKSGSFEFLILRGNTGMLSGDSTNISIRICRDSAGTWQMYADTTGGNFYRWLGATKDASVFSNAKYAGIWVKHSAATNTKFFWDNFTTIPFKFDVTPPALVHVSVMDSLNIIAEFDDELDSASANDSSHYSGYGSPFKVKLISANKVNLLLSNPLKEKKTYLLTANKIKNINGNALFITEMNYTYYKRMSSVVITELYPDTSPTIKLPVAEYVELQNVSGADIDLANYSLSDGSTSGKMSTYILRKDSFVVLCSKTDLAKFAGITNAIALSSWPALNNSGDNISLKDAGGTLIDYVPYNTSWYHNSAKSNGGWSIEKIDADNSCAGINNWTASVDSSGGTPGRKNSVSGMNIKDRTPPSITDVSAINNTNLRISFSEDIDTAVTGINEILINNTPDIKKIIYQENSVIINTLSAFQNSVVYAIKIIALADCKGNYIYNPLSYTFTYTKPVSAPRYGILIHEFMPDPSPVVSMPDAEYAELYNNTKSEVSLTGYTFTDGHYTALLPDFKLAAGRYVILCAKGNENLFAPYGKVFGLSNFPSLNNDGDTLSLRDANGMLIHSVAYSSAWFTDAVKKNGGWSLEMKDENNPCAGIENWAASVDSRGGTPGMDNSIKRTVIDKTSPYIKTLGVQDSMHIIIHFSEGMDSSIASSNVNYIINPVLNISSVSVSPPTFSKALITLSSPIKSNTLYSLSVRKISDCSGNTADSTTLSVFALPLLPDSFDVVINELLPSPATGGVEYVELYNRSNKLVDLKDMFLATLDDSNKVKTFSPLSTDGYLLLPDDYVIICTSADKVKSYFNVPSPNKINEVSYLISLSDAGTKTALLRNDYKLLDRVDYTSKWHYSLIKNTHGVSLEKINPNLISNTPSSWHSAASSVGYGTPTYKNSEYLDDVVSANKNFNADPPVFSPDEDGYQDVLKINYSLNKPGYTANVRIYDSEGRLVKTLMNSKSISTEGILVWDGITDDNKKANIGIYVVVADLFTADGDVQNFKFAVTLAGKL